MILTTYSDFLSGYFTWGWAGKNRSKAHPFFLHPLHSSISLTSLFLLHFFPPFFHLFPAMPQSWLRVLVYVWVTLLCLWSFLLLSIFSYLPAFLSVYLSIYRFSVSFCLPCFVVSHCFLLFYLPLFPTPDSHFVVFPVYLLPASAIIYLLSQSHIFFSAWSLTHWFCLIL